MISIEKETSRIASAHQRSKYVTVPPSQANPTGKHTHHVGKELSTHVCGPKMKSVSGEKRSIEEKKEEEEEKEQEKKDEKKEEEEEEEVNVPSSQCQESAAPQSMCIELDVSDDQRSREKIRKLLDKLQSEPILISGKISCVLIVYLVF